MINKLHPRKHHLESLPELSTDFGVQGDSKTACLVLPVFQAHNNNAVEIYTAKASAWALSTWRKNTDATAYNIPCFIFVEDTITEIALPILEENGVPASMIYVGQTIPNAHYAKSLSPIFDKVMSNYDYLLISDVDTFAVAPQDGYVPIFENLFQCNPESIGISEHWNCNPPFLEAGTTHWLNNFSYAMPRNIKGNWKKLFGLWYETVKNITNENVANHYIEKDKSFVYPFASLWIIPKNAVDRDWLYDASVKLADDEAVMSVWQAETKHKFWKLSDIGILHENSPNMAQHFKVEGYSGVEMLYHFGSSIDYSFMRCIGK